MTAPKSLLSLSFILLLLVSFSCAKEQRWDTDIITTYDITTTDARIDVEFNLKRNDNYVYVGVCWSETEDPVITNDLTEKQQLDSDLESFYLFDLTPGTTYYLRSFIKTKNNGVIYSDNFPLTTNDFPVAPCEPEAGNITFNTSTFGMYDLYESTIDDYQLSTSCSFGELTFIFNAKPTSGIYTTTESASFLTSSTVHVSGILGAGWLTCYHGTGSSEQNIHVNVLDSGDISLTFCDLQLSPTGSCEEIQLLTGEVHQ